MKNITNDGYTNIFEWFKKIIDEFYEEQAIEEHTSFNKIKIYISQ